MRGTNVCAYRFFEDAERGDRPWRASGSAGSTRSSRACTGTRSATASASRRRVWYDIADEEGFLIQDEFPIWLLGEAPEKVKAEKIIPEYTEWMRERWNHPCVVIWDAQNESNTPETGKALQAVRALDLSNRPWDNGWAEPQSDRLRRGPSLPDDQLFNPPGATPRSSRAEGHANVSGVPRRCSGPSKAQGARSSSTSTPGSGSIATARPPA
jgi:hypothetical protein